MKRFVLLVLVVAACGSKNPGDDDVDAPVGGPCDTPPDLSDRYYPWAVGTTWTYLLTDPVGGGTEVNDTVVQAWEEVGAGETHTGKCSFKVSGEKLFGNTISWNGYEGDKGVRYAQIDYDQNNVMVDEQDQDPFRLKMDETHLSTGQTYSETFDETTRDGSGTNTRSKTENWEVVSASESVTVPAGTYDAVHLRRTNAADPTKVKDFWFVQGVGKVKETGGEQDQDLMAYTPAN